jgi:hypothetical protein
VKSCAEESTYAGMTDAAGKTYPEVHSEYTTEYDINGCIVATFSSNSHAHNGSRVMRTTLPVDSLKTTSGVEGQAITETTYSYDHQGRLQNISDDGRLHRPVTFRYDERGRKSKIEISRPAD